MRVRIFPVIHHLDRETTLRETIVARDYGADGVFLISHTGEDDELVHVAWEAQHCSKDFPIGVNLLSMPASAAAAKALEAQLKMLWADEMGVDSGGLDECGRAMADFASRHQDMEFFASVAFKYRRHEEHPVEAALNARNAGFIPTTSGAATGKAPAIEKIRGMASAGRLAIASGMTPENVGGFVPYLTDILVATGISRSEHHIDPGKLIAFVRSVRESESAASADK
jgi:predicted TIM-barrel enzyme